MIVSGYNKGVGVAEAENCPAKVHTGEVKSLCLRQPPRSKDKREHFNWKAAPSGYTSRRQPGHRWQHLCALNCRATKARSSRASIRTGFSGDPSFSSSGRMTTYGSFLVTECPRRRRAFFGVTIRSCSLDCVSQKIDGSAFFGST